MRSMIAGILLGAVFALPAGAAPFTVSSPTPSKVLKLKLRSDYKDTDTKDTLVFPKIGLEVPLMENLSMTVSGNFRNVDRVGGEEHYGFGDVEIEGKWQFLDAKDNSLGVAMGINPELTLATGNDRKGLGTGNTEIYLPLVMSKKVGPWEFGGEIGYHHMFEQHEDEMTYGVLVMRRVAPDLRLGAELVVDAPPSHFSDYDLTMNGGFKWALSSKVELHGLVGHSLRTVDGNDVLKVKVGLDWKF
ncbi:hypothetical protein [Govanella unica]|uniref:Uncharacterized protein n=1 Tax=Govanella unica TaxID=2975056 RepID=A0A9X3Z793_9PROT|nr:hypothetical protein [Govania unica]MDA5193907.1 hypothetical protein [Govania unica]